MKLDATTLRQLSPLLDEALELEGAERESWIAGLRGEAALLAPTLRALLARQSTVETNDFLARGPEFTVPGEETHASDFAAGGAIGPYRLLRVIGHGGMGEVWLAERADGQLKRSIALKLPMLSLRRNVLVQRFERERNILGALVHPHIARLYDAGFADDGQPYMALEYVEGRPITEAADAQALDAKARLRLLRQVMDAVQYAHANLVIHRDLKPGNVLVTADGKAMLLDFGIAKLVEDEAGAAMETELTRLGGRALTLHYAAPEQISGAPISTATDIWALGVLLYELLTGLKPFDGEGRGKLEQDVLTGEPARPSQRKAGAITRLSKSLAADLDTIVLKALKKNPTERYATVSALADDLDRWLHGEAVLAQPDSRWYRARKFFGRHKLAVTSATLASITIIGIALVAVVLGFQAREESARAKAARDFMIDLFRRTDPDLSKGKDVGAKQLLVEGYKTVVETMNEQPLLQTDLLMGIADALNGIEDWAASDKAYVRATLLYRQIGKPGDAAHATLDRAVMRLAKGWEVSRAVELLSEAAINYPAHASDDEFMARYATFHSFAAHLSGNAREVREWYERARPHANRALRDDTGRTVLTIRILGVMEGDLGEYQSGIDRLNVLLARLEKNKGTSPSDIVGILDDLGYVELAAGRYRAALRRYDAAATLCGKEFNPKGGQCKYTQSYLATVLLLLGYHERAMDTVPILLAPSGSAESTSSHDDRNMVNAYNVLVRNRQLARYPDLPARVSALGDFRGGEDTRWEGKSLSMRAQARMYLQDDRPQQAQDISDRLQAHISSRGSDNPRDAAQALVLRGLAAHALGKHVAAMKVLDDAYTGQVKTLGAAHPQAQLISIHRARPLWAMQQRDQALALLDHAIPVLQEAMGADAPKFRKIEALREEIATTLPNAETARKVDVLL